MADETLTGLTLEVRREEGAGVYSFGVELDGAFVVFAQRKLGRVDSLRAAAAEQASASAEQAPQTPTTPSTQG